MDHHDHGRAVVLDGEVVVGENHGEVALVPADRLPGPLSCCMGTADAILFRFK